MASDVFVKHPSETYPIGFDYTGKAPTGAILQSGTWSATDLSDSSDVSGTVLLNTAAVIDGAVAKCRVQSGTDGKQYRLDLEATFDTGDVLHDYAVMVVDVSE